MRELREETTREGGSGRGSEGTQPTTKLWKYAILVIVVSLIILTVLCT